MTDGILAERQGAGGGGAAWFTVRRNFRADAPQGLLGMFTAHDG
jgi:hypothetical protein